MVPQGGSAIPSLSVSGQEGNQNLTGVAVAIGGGKSGQGVTRFGQCVAGRLLAVGRSRNSSR